MEATLKFVFFFPSEKESTPLGANSLLLEWTPFQNETGMQESNQEITKVVSLVKESE